MTSTTLMTTAALADMADFAVGEAQVCPATRTISGPGGTIQLEPRIMQVLIVLAEAEGGVVTRDTLLNRCWGGFYAGDDSLNRAIAGVRRAASGVGSDSFEIETIPRTGYRLVTRSEGRDTLPAGESAGSTPHGSSHLARRTMLAGGLAAGLAGVAFWKLRVTGPDQVSRLMDDSRTAMRAGDPAKAREAIGLLRKAVAIAPAHASAWGLLALTLARADEHAIDVTISPAGEVEKAARRALQLDPNNADASASLAIAIPYFGDWLNAERRFDQVIAKHPGHLYVRDSRVFFLGAVGRMRESAVERVELVGDDPFDANLQYRRIYGLWFLGRIAEADQVADRGLEMWPGHTGIWFGKLWVLADTGRFDRALAHIADATRRPPLPQPMIATLNAGIIAAKTKGRADIDRAVGMIMGSVSHSVAAVVNAMMLLNLMKVTDKAFELSRAYYLEQGPIIAAMEWRPGQPIVPDQRRRKTNIIFTPTASDMQKDPRFPGLMADMGLADYWRQRGIVPDFLSRAAR